LTAELSINTSSGGPPADARAWKISAQIAYMPYAIGKLRPRIGSISVAICGSETEDLSVEIDNQCKMIKFGPNLLGVLH